MKVKIFAADVRLKTNDLPTLETEINVWLASNPEITVYMVNLTRLEQSLVCVLSYYEEKVNLTLRSAAFNIPFEEEPEEEGDEQPEDISVDN